ncbi:hypothetical protein BH18ACT15_BH18ACT15_14080 [soil metagenome]
MTVRKALVLTAPRATASPILIGFFVLMFTSQAWAKGAQGVAGLFDSRGVQATAKSGYEIKANDEGNAAAQSARSAPYTQAYEAPSGGSSVSVNSGSSAGASGKLKVVNVPVVIGARNCAPIYGTAREGLSYQVAPSGSSDCMSFVVLPSGRPAPTQPSKPSKGNGDKGGSAPEPPSYAQLAQLISERVIALAPAPSIAAAPNEIGLTGLDSFFWLAEPLAPVTATAEAPGITVSATASPVRYEWSFGDGGALTTDGPGRPWRAGRPGDISHLYETKGRYDVSVTVVWAARWQIGDGPSQPLGLFATSGSRAYPVREVVSRLTQSEH